MRITPTSGLPPDEIERIIQEAETYTEADRQVKDAVILRNKLDTLLRNTQKSYSKFGGLLSENDQTIAEKVFTESGAVLHSTRVGPISEALTKLERVAAQLTTAMMETGKENVPTEVSGTH